MTIPREQIDQLLNEAKESVVPMELYSECVKRYVDETALFGADNLSPLEIAVNFALAGYYIGIETALNNLDIK